MNDSNILILMMIKSRNVRYTWRRRKEYKRKGERSGGLTRLTGKKKKKKKIMILVLVVVATTSYYYYVLLVVEEGGGERRRRLRRT